MVVPDSTAEGRDSVMDAANKDTRLGIVGAGPIGAERLERIFERWSISPTTPSHPPDVVKTLELSDWRQYHPDHTGGLAALVGVEGARRLICQWYFHDVYDLLAEIGRLEAEVAKADALNDEYVQAAP